MKEQLLRQAWMLVDYPDTAPELTDEDRDYAHQVVLRMAKAVGVDEF